MLFEITEWPLPYLPGVPLNGECDGWHILVREGVPHRHFWEAWLDAGSPEMGHWEGIPAREDIGTPAELAAHLGYLYAGPCDPLEMRKLPD
jgi:hypothetical protein